MRAYLSLPYPSYVIHDLVSHNAELMVHSEYFSEQFYFLHDDLDSFEIPKSGPRFLKPVFTFIRRKIVAKKRNLNALFVLKIIEKNGECKVCISDIHTPKESLQIEFEKNKWAQVEEAFLVSGLVVVNQTEQNVLTYKLKEYSALFEITMKNQSDALLEIQTPSEEEMISALTIIGYSMEEARFV